MDRNRNALPVWAKVATSLSARRAWIEIAHSLNHKVCVRVALRKESVDRNGGAARARVAQDGSLSARRAWIEISAVICGRLCRGGRSPQGERG